MATADLLYTYWVNQLYFTDANLTAPIGTAAGEGGRLLYGTIDSLGRETPVAHQLGVRARRPGLEP